MSGRCPAWIPFYEGVDRIALIATLAALTLGPQQSHRATYYSVPPCDRQTTQTASGQHVRFGIIASNFIPLYTWIKLNRPLRGLRYFQVLDTGAPFDVWLPCDGRVRNWTNPRLGYRVVTRRAT